MAYRTRTYLAADWDTDIEVIDKLRSWNDSDYWGLSFTDAHDLMKAKDTSLNCTIKSSLGDRMDASKTFVLVVGTETKSLRAGSCYYCKDYDFGKHGCKHGWSTSSKSYIEYECDKAKRDGLKIVVLYNSGYVFKDRCPDSLKDEGRHIAAFHWEGTTKKWNYANIKSAIMD